MTTPLTSQLPPCKVCGHPSSGFHYGVTTCVACKGFFRRSLRRMTPYVCVKQGSCVVGQGQKRRSNCSKCRLDRCIAVGMSKSAIKTGRYSSEKKSQDMLEILELHAAGKMAHKQPTTESHDDHRKPGHKTVIQRPSQVYYPRHTVFAESWISDRKREELATTSAWTAELRGNNRGSHSEGEFCSGESQSHEIKSPLPDYDSYPNESSYKNTRGKTTSHDVLNWKDYSDSITFPPSKLSSDTESSMLRTAEKFQLHESCMSLVNVPENLSENDETSLRFPSAKTFTDSLIEKLQQDGDTTVNLDSPESVSSPSSCDSSATSGFYNTQNSLLINEAHEAIHSGFVNSEATYKLSDSTPEQGNWSQGVENKHETYGRMTPVSQANPMCTNDNAGYSEDAFRGVNLLEKQVDPHVIVHDDDSLVFDIFNNAIDSRMFASSPFMRTKQLELAFETWHISSSDVSTNSPSDPLNNDSIIGPFSSNNDSFRVTPTLASTNQQKYSHQVESDGHEFSFGNSVLSQGSTFLNSYDPCATSERQSEPYAGEVQTDSYSNLGATNIDSMYFSSGNPSHETKTPNSSNKYYDSREDVTNVSAHRISLTNQTSYVSNVISEDNDFIDEPVTGIKVPRILEKCNFPSYELAVLRPFLKRVFPNFPTNASSEETVGTKTSGNDACSNTGQNTSTTLESGSQSSNRGSFTQGPLPWCEYTVEYLDGLITTLESAHAKHDMWDMNSLSEKELKFRLSQYHRLCLLKEQVFGRRTFMKDFSTYKMVLEKLGIDLDGRINYVETIAPVIEVTLRKTIRFFKAIPGFKRLCSDDKMTLAKGAQFEFWLLSNYRGYDPDSDIWLSYDNIGKSLGEFRGLWDAYDHKLDLLTQAYKMLMDLDLSVRQVIILKAIVVTTPDRLPVQEFDKVEQLNWKYYCCLLLSLHRTHPNPHRQYTKIVSAMTFLRSVSEAHNGFRKDHQTALASMFGRMEANVIPLTLELYCQPTDSGGPSDEVD